MLLLLAYLTGAGYPTPVPRGVAALPASGMVGLEARHSWAVWQNLAQLPLLTTGNRASMTSSYCREGCRFDRHSHAAPKFMRILAEEGVLFEDWGAGVISRIWMTMGEGVSTPLDPSILIRITVDGQIVVEMPLPDFFKGDQAPFLFPMNGDRDSSSGGNFCYTPIPYRDGCRISLLNARAKRFWFQISHHRIFDRERVTGFDGSEELDYWRRLLGQPGANPWEGIASPLLGGSVIIEPGGEVELLQRAGSDVVYAMTLRVPSAYWSSLHLEITMDDTSRVSMPLSDFFAVGARYDTPTRSLFLGFEGIHLYCYFPMPFFCSARITLSDPHGHLSQPLAVTYQFQSAGFAAPSNAGYFTAIGKAATVSLGQSYTLFDLQGRGKWVGLFAEMGSVGNPSLNYLEGDERVFLDGSETPQFHGTGVEDFFNGGFYFRDAGNQPEPFQLALHGMIYHLSENGESTTAMYRFMAADAVSFETGARAELEAGPRSNIAMRAKTVAYFYLDDPTPARMPREKRSPHQTRPYSSGEPLQVETSLGPPVSRAAAILFADPLLEDYFLRGVWLERVSGDPIPYDSDADGTITQDEALAVTGSVDIGFLAIAAFDELRFFSNISSLRITASAAVELQLEDLAELTHLLLTRNDNLVRVWLCDLSALKHLEWRGNDALTELVLIDTTALETVISDNNPILTFPFLDGLARLQNLKIARGTIEMIDLGDLAELREVVLADLPALTSLALQNLPDLEHLRVTSCPSLAWLELDGLPGLRAIELKANPLLAHLVAANNQNLEAVILGNNRRLDLLSLIDLPLLKWLDAAENLLTRLHISQCPALEGIRLTHNHLESLNNLEVLPELEWLDSADNLLRCLPGMPNNLTFLDLYGNRIMNLANPQLPRDLVFAELGLNHILEISGLTQAPGFLTEPVDYLGLTKNFLNGGDCKTIVTLADRSQQSGAVFSFQTQRLAYLLWPEYQVLDLIRNGFQPLDCLQ